MVGFFIVEKRAGIDCRIHRMLFIIVFLISGILDGYPQKKERKLELSLGVENIKISDQYFSPMTYRGLPFFAAFGYLTETNAFKDDLNLEFQQGYLKPVNGNMAKGSETRLTGGSIIWEHARKLNRYSNPKCGLYIGGVFNSSFTYYKRNYYGDDTYYLYQSSLGPLFRCIQSFTLFDKTILLDHQTSFALLAYAVYPSYSSAMTDKMLEKDLNDISAFDYLTGGKFHSISKFQCVNYRISMVYELNFKTAMILNYNWELINISRQNHLTRASHDFFLSFLVKIK